jgi:hypothetical protein
MPIPALAVSLWLAAAPPPGAATAAAPADPWAPLRFLVGTWKTEGGGKPGDVVGGGFTFSIDLDGKVAIRRGRAEVAPRTADGKGTVHEDLTVISPKGKGLQAWYWDNEGHVIRYAVRSEAGIVIFESEAGVPGPRFRLSYARRGADQVEISFSIAPPGKPFTPYVTGQARRVRDPS